MPDYVKLKTEIDTDPEGYGYAIMSDEEVAFTLNIKDRPRNRETMSGAEAYGRTDSAEYDLLADEKKSQWLALCAIETVDPFGPAEGAVVDIFGNGSTTIGNLQAARVELISRGVEIGSGFSTVTSQHVIDVRAM